MIRVKPEHLDTMVSTPTTHRLVTLRFLDKSMYERFAKHYPDFFEDDNKWQKKEFIKEELNKKTDRLDD